MTTNLAVYVAGKPIHFGVLPNVGPSQVALRSIEVSNLAGLRDAIVLLEAEGVDGLHLVPLDGFALWEQFQSLYKFVLAAGGTVTDERGRLLVIRRLGMWDLPKGKVERGEEVRSAAVREVQEECGLEQVSLGSPLTSTWHTYERKGKQHLKRTDWFMMKANSDQPLKAQVEEDIEEVRWADREEVARMMGATYPSLIPVLKAWSEQSATGEL